MARTLLLVLSWLGALAPGLFAHQYPFRREPAFPGRFAATVEEGSPWGEEGLFLRLNPPQRGLSPTLPQLWAFPTHDGYLVREVYDPVDSPRNRPRGWARLGPIPENGVYRIQLEPMRNGASATLYLQLQEKKLLLSLSGDAQGIENPVPVSSRLARGAFTFRWDHTDPCCHPARLRRAWKAYLQQVPGIYAHEEAAHPLSDPSFEEWVDDGGPLLYTWSRKIVEEAAQRFARQTGLDMTVRWYGGASLRLRGFRRADLEDPGPWNSLEYLIPPHLRKN